MKPFVWGTLVGFVTGAFLATVVIAVMIAAEPKQDTAATANDLLGQNRFATHPDAVHSP